MQIKLTYVYFLSAAVLAGCGDESTSPVRHDGSSPTALDATARDTSGTAAADAASPPPNHDAGAGPADAADLTFHAGEVRSPDAVAPPRDAAPPLVDAPLQAPDAPGLVRDVPAVDAVPVTQGQLVNVTAYIPPQCYAQTKSPKGHIDNPCYTCHRKGAEPNFVDDSTLQLDYVMPQAGRTNPWTNLFQDRSASLAAISDATMTAYVSQDNYAALPAKLRRLPAAWDQDGDGQWSDFLPDLALSYDDRGFDRTLGAHARPKHVLRRAGQSRPGPGPRAPGARALPRGNRARANGPLPERGCHHGGGSGGDAHQGAAPCTQGPVADLRPAGRHRAWRDQGQARLPR